MNNSLNINLLKNAFIIAGGEVSNCNYYVFVLGYRLTKKQAYRKQRNTLKCMKNMELISNAF